MVERTDKFENGYSVYSGSHVVIKRLWCSSVLYWPCM